MSTCKIKNNNHHNSLSNSLGSILIMEKHQESQSMTFQPIKYLSHGQWKSENMNISLLSVCMGIYWKLIRDKIIYKVDKIIATASLLFLLVVFI